MPYATIEDVQSRIAVQEWVPTPTSQPSITMVEQWLVGASNFVDGALAHRYAVPIDGPSDRETLREIVADFVAGRVWATLGDTSAAEYWKQEARAALGYDSRTKQASLILPGSTASTADEAELGIQTGTLYVGEQSPYSDYLADLEYGL